VHLHRMLGRSDLIGRAPELQALSTYLTQAKQGAGAALLVRAPAGMGKSRLLQEALARAEQAGIQTFAGRAFELEADFPYAIIADAFQPYLRAHPEQAAALTVRAPELATLFPTAAAGAAVPGAPAAKLFLFEAFVTFLRGLTESRPALLVLDDLHWADPASLELIHYVAHNLADLPVLLLMACRSEEETGNDRLQGMMASLVRTGHLTTLALGPLTERDVAEITRQLLQMAQPPDEELVRLLFQETGGNPFFLAETLKAMLDARLLYRQEGRWRRRSMAGIAVPASIREVILGRIGRLSREERRLLELLAVYGVRIPLQTLRALADLDEGKLVDLLDHLLAVQLFEEEQTPQGPVYKFAHPKIQETLYSELSAARRQALHGEVARRLERFYQSLPEPALDAHADELAQHFGLAGQAQDLARSIAYDIRAGDRAAALFAYDRAAALYLRAVLHLEHTDGLLSPQAQFDLLDKLGRTYERTGDFTAAAEFWDQALHLVQMNPQVDAGPERLAALYHNLARVHWAHGDRVRALAYCDQGLAVLADVGLEGAAAAALQHERFAVLLRHGGAAEAEAALRAERQLAHRSGDPIAEAVAAADQAALLLWTGRLTLAIQEGQGALAQLQRVRGTQTTLLSVHQDLAWASFGLGDHGQARRHCEEALTLTQRFGLTALRGGPLFLLSLLDLAAGNRANAAALALQAVTEQRAHRSPSLGLSLSLLALTEACSGDRAAAAESYTEAERVVAHVYGAQPSLEGMIAYAALARYREVTLDLVGALAYYQRAAEMMEQLGYPFLLTAPEIGLANLPAVLGRLARTKEAQRWAARLEAARAALPARKEPPREAPGSTRPDGLSKREIDVIREVCRHKTDREIAAALYISVRTVTTHLTNIYNKLGMHSRTQLVQYGLRHGLDR
jgi:DNA-binding CsgD family transcriptional regulator